MHILFLYALNVGILDDGDGTAFRKLLSGATLGVLAPKPRTQGSA